LVIAFDAASFKNNPIGYIGPEKFMSPGTSGSLTSTDTTGTATLPNVTDMQIKTINNQTSLKYFSVSDSGDYVATANDRAVTFGRIGCPGGPGMHSRSR
jgi:hypothetical protein